ncbi:MAG: NAD(P)H-hydrate dehydratase [Alphaproteobacteria bacterium]|nr:NAD(P)H-hydrate dehydratase [Alphaproteobacteria bacterium]
MELLTPADMAAADRLTIAGGIAGMALMENAGRAVADAVVRRARRTAPLICVVAGPGNNGGDGFVAARVLRERGYPVRVMLLGDRDKLKGDAAEAAARWAGDVEPAGADGLAGAGLIVDALFGAGLDRPVAGAARTVIDAMNAGGVPVVAVDLPSGISGASGAVMGAAVRATETVTFFRRKPGHLLLPGRLHCGPIEVADIGNPDAVLEKLRPSLFVNCPALWAERFPVPRPEAHKYSRGHAVVVSGDASHTGAARLAARGALRAGAGLVTLASPPDALAINAASYPAVMVRAVDGPGALGEMLADVRLNAVVLGPGAGVGARTRELALTALAGERAVVLDADALTSFADESEALFSAIKARDGLPTLLTPHEGEFARLFRSGARPAEMSSKCDRALIAAVDSGATVVLKGPDTVVASPGGRISIAENAPPWLATAGSGDVLAGMAAGLLAQGMPAFEGASAAVWLHGEAGNEVGPGLISEDLPEALPAVYRRLFVDLGAWP